MIFRIKLAIAEPWSAELGEAGTDEHNAMAARYVAALRSYFLVINLTNDTVTDSEYQLAFISIEVFNALFNCAVLRYT